MKISSKLLQMALIGLISLYGARVSKTEDIVYDNDVYGSDDWQVGAIIVIFAASVGFATEGIMILLHFLNPYCFNNRYKIVCVMIITIKIAISYTNTHAYGLCIH